MAGLVRVVLVVVMAKVGKEVVEGSAKMGGC